MQSGYGVSEIPQFMVDGICSPFFPVNATGADMSQTQKQNHNLHQQLPFSQQQQQQHQHHHYQQHQQQQQYHHFHQYPHHPHHQLQLQLEHHHHHHQSAQPPPMHHQQQEARFPPHFHPIPITQQLFQQTHQFHLFQQEQQRRLQHQAHHHHLVLDQDPTPAEPSASPPRMDATIGSGGGGGGGIPPFLGPSMSFRLSVNDNSGGNSRDRLNDDDTILHGDDVDGSESRWPPPTSREEDPVIKEPFWRPLDLDLEYIDRNNKRCKEDQHERQQIELEGSCTVHVKLNKEHTATGVEDGTNGAGNYKLFSELEAICKPGTATTNNNNQTGSSSALTGENHPTMLAEPSPVDEGNVEEAVGHNEPSDTSIGEEASLKKITTSNNTGSKRTSKERKRKRRKQQLCSIAAFFETLVKQLMDHQENLHRKFVQVLEKRDQERMTMEEAWRQQEATRSSREAKAREEQQVIAAAREAVIVSFLEKITGESICLPTKAQFECEDHNNNSSMKDGINKDSGNQQQQALVSSNRWPKAEVQALIRVRSGLEARFQEPGLKGPLWEEVSSAMVAMGYRRSAKRCKEKWENINKYFRKTKESAKKRPRHSKTCPYFHQLDQLYSKASTAAPIMTSTATTTTNATTTNVDRKGNSELLDAIIVSNEKNGFSFSDQMMPLRLEVNSNAVDDDDDVLNVAVTKRQFTGRKGRLLEFRRGHNEVDGDHHRKREVEGHEGYGEEEDGEGDGVSPATTPTPNQLREEEEEEEEEEDNSHHHHLRSHEATLSFSRIES